MLDLNCSEDKTL